MGEELLKTEKNERKLLLLVRISKPEYNKTLWHDYEIYMNRQANFRDPKYNHGQYDKYEGAILKGPFDFKCYDGEKVGQVHMNEDGILYKENNAYVFCMYEIEFDFEMYVEESNEFYHIISWDYIKPLWGKGGLEMMIIKNTSVFLKKFEEAAEREGKKRAKGLVEYDLQDKLHDRAYFEEALRDDFEAVYHKVDDYKEQKEYRLAIKDDSGNESLKLVLKNDNTLKFNLFPIKYGKDIMVVISDLEFDPQTHTPIRFSPNVRYLESVDSIESL